MNSDDGNDRTLVSIRLIGEPEARRVLIAGIEERFLPESRPGSWVFSRDGHVNDVRVDTMEYIVVHASPARTLSPSVASQLASAGTPAVQVGLSGEEDAVEAVVAFVRQSFRSRPADDPITFASVTLEVDPTARP